MNDARPVIRGLAVVFDSLSENLGGFRERIKPEAVQRTLRDKLDVRALVNHDDDPSHLLGRVGAGTLRLAADPRGLQVEIDPPQTTIAVDLMRSIQRGDISGMSFGFKTITDEWHMENDQPVREVLDMTIFDVSVVTWPAYPSTSVSVRGLRLRVDEARLTQTRVESEIEQEAHQGRVRTIEASLRRS